MARRIVTMYDISSSVGQNGQNLPSDVMLIQFFLFTIFLNSGFPISGPFSIDDANADPAAIFPIDGNFEPGLIRWISMFQRQANQAGMGPLVVDGRVDPSQVGWGLRSGRTAGRRTIMAFNQVLLNGDRARFERLPSDPNMPAALGGALQVGGSVS